MVTLESQCVRAKINHHAWLEVNHCLDQTESVQEYLRKHRQGLVTSAPDPFSLCAGSNGADSNFYKENARVFPCISEVVAWCDPSPASAADSSEATVPSSTSSSSSYMLTSAGRVQILVTGSLHLVGAAMDVLGCKIEDL